MSRSVNLQNIGLGPTAELSLRVSVASLVRVTFPHPDTGQQILAFEHRGTVISNNNNQHVEVMVQAFGGAIRILNISSLLKIAGNFHFDSRRSRDEQDFRIFIRPGSWETIKTFCLQNFTQPTGSALETEPTRELVEEFEDTIGVLLHPGQYKLKTIGTILENKPLPTANVHATGAPTARIYRLFEAQITDEKLIHTILTNSQSHSAETLRELALEDFHQGKKGRSNAMFTIPSKKIRAAYLALPPEERGKPFQFMNTTLDRNVSAVLDNIFVPAYQFIPNQV